MTFWDFLASRKWPDARGWISLGCFILTVMILLMIRGDKKLLDNQAFLVIASMIIASSWNGGPVGWAFQATKSGGEAAESTARIAEQAATAALPTQADLTTTDVNLAEVGGKPVETKT